MVVAMSLARSGAGKRSVLSPFTELGRAVDASWRASHYDERRFAKVAAAALSEARVSDRVELEDLLDAICAGEDLPEQRSSGFGEPPIVAFRTERFLIEVLPWLDGTTDLHQHGFAGAFTVLHGRSLHSEFEFECEYRYSERLAVGALRPRAMELLQVGDVRAIPLGSEFIHSLFHLDRPSVSVVVRTLGGSVGGPQLSYSRRSGLCWDPFHRVASSELLRQLLPLLPVGGEERCKRRLRSLLERADAWATFQLVLQLGRELGSRAAVEEAIEGFSLPQPELVRRSLLEVQERARARSIIERRARLISADHRFLLAVALNVRGRQRCLGIVEELYPGRSGASTITRWVAELSEASQLGQGGVLGLRFDDAALEVLERMLLGVSDEQLVGGLLERYGREAIDAQRPRIDQLQRLLRRSPLFEGFLVED